MLCINPGSSELRTRLMSAARGLMETSLNLGTEWIRPDSVESACLLLEFRESQRSGSGACFFVVCEVGRST
jgi:hypothetical protein